MGNESFLDFREPLLIEIELARQVNVAAYETLPHVDCPDKRSHLAAALAHIAIEHGSSILSLFAQGALASGYALMRPALETTYKCVWIACVADDTKVDKVWNGRDAYGKFEKVIEEIREEFKGTGFAEVFGKINPYLRALHERTHSGKDQTFRRLRSPDMRIPEYDLGGLIGDVRTLASAAVLAAIPIASLEDVDKLKALMTANYSWLAGKNRV